MKNKSPFVAEIPKVSLDEFKGLWKKSMYQ
jgi:hypothetical protein